MTLPIAERKWKGQIESISQEGLGIGTITAFQDGKSLRRPIFVPFTVPGDLIEAEVVEQKRKYAFGDIKNILTPSKQRVIPKCPHFMTCGGCNLQHISYDEQLRQKAQQIEFLLKRKGAQLPHPISVLPTKQRSNYRWRAKIAIDFTGDRIIAGFRKFHAHDVVQVKSCSIVAPQILELIAILNRAESSIGSRGRFTQELIVVVGESKKLGLLVPLDDAAPQHRKQLKDFFEGLYSRNRKLIANLFFEENRATKTPGQVQDHISYKVDGLTFSFLPETFIQSNIATNEQLVSTVLEFLFRDENGKDDVVIDLYAGIGNISLPIAKRVKTVVAVEAHEASALLGRINAYQNKIENALFVHRSAEKYVYEYVKHRKAGKQDEEYPLADKVVIDPPRTGCTPQVLKGLLESGVRRILYISCNPVTLANDLVALSAKYQATEITGIDMFPDISHVETVVLLEKKD
jgi:23S rRNA (uracil1939-C5)-methyltransferase